jgi:general secretion pathway protein E
MTFEWITKPAQVAAPEPAPTPLATVTTTGGRPAEPTTVEHAEDLPYFSQKLYDLVGMQPSLKHRLCPIDVSTDERAKTFAVVLLHSELNTDLTATLIANLGFKGWTLARDAYFVATTSVMVELARDGINENRTGGKGAAGAKKQDSALWNLFEGAALFALQNDSSDIHIQIDRTKADSQIKFRVDGRLTQPREFQIDTFKLLDMVAYMYNVHSNSGSENTFNENQAQQCQIACSIKGAKVLFRWASNKTAVGTKVVMRVIRQDSEQTIRPLEALGYLPPQVLIWKRAISRLGGGTLVAGVVGSGKSTTMQTVLSMLPRWMAVYTAEDPVENLIPGADQFTVSRSLTDEEGDPFLAIKRQTKRMDPDAVLVGEIRDRESASLFREIAESGHRAFSTVHAPSAIDMITLRLVSSELGIPRDVIATPNFINLLVYQALVPKLCECKVAATSVYDDAYLSRIERLFDINRTQLNVQNHEGCEQCRRKGLAELNGSKGRVVVAEMIEPTSKMLLLFRDLKNLELKRYIRSLRKARFDEPDSTGKSALEVAMYHVAHGTVDPREVEVKFGSFEHYEQERDEQAAGAAEDA